MDEEWSYPPKLKDDGWKDGWTEVEDGNEPVLGLGYGLGETKFC